MTRYQCMWDGRRVIKDSCEIENISELANCLVECGDKFSFTGIGPLCLPLSHLHSGSQLNFMLESVQSCLSFQSLASKDSDSDGLDPLGNCVMQSALKTLLIALDFGPKNMHFSKLSL